MAGGRLKPFLPAMKQLKLPRKLLVFGSFSYIQHFSFSLYTAKKRSIMNGIIICILWYNIANNEVQTTHAEKQNRILV
jgi:hypothetical protein